MGCMEIEGWVRVNGVEISNGDRPVSIDTSKVVLFYTVNTDRGDCSDLVIVTDTQEIRIEGQGEDIANYEEGTGKHYYDILKEYIDAPMGVNYRRDHKIFIDDDIEVTEVK